MTFWTKFRPYGQIHIVSTSRSSDLYYRDAIAVWMQQVLGEPKPVKNPKHLLDGRVPHFCCPMPDTSLSLIQRLRGVLTTLMEADPSWPLIQEITEISEVPLPDPPGNLCVLLDFMAQHGFDLPEDETEAILVCLFRP